MSDRRSGILLLIAFTAAGRGSAQGVTTAALEGTVRSGEGAPLPNANVLAVSLATGQRWRVTTGGAGRYYFESLGVGGAYRVEVTAIGFSPARSDGVLLFLGDRARADFVLERAAVRLDTLKTTAARAARPMGGPVTVVAESAIAALPNLQRDYQALAVLSPHVGMRPRGGVSIAGQNQLYNSYRIDGGVDQDVYLGRVPGGESPAGAGAQTLPRSISLEAVQEFQVAATPFDVRFGNFGGGLLNAVTRSGTNTRRGDLLLTLQDSRFTTPPPGAVASAGFTRVQLAGSLSGPLLRDRAQYFVSADLQRWLAPDRGPFLGDPIRLADLTPYGISSASAIRFRDLLTGQYGIPAGSLGASDGHQPAVDLFGKLSFHTPANGELEISDHVALGTREGFLDGARVFRLYSLTSASERDHTVAHTARAIWRGLLRGVWFPEVQLSYQHISDRCEPYGRFPRIEVSADSGKLAAGPNTVCPTSDLVQSSGEAGAALTRGVGRHLVTGGARAGFLAFRDPLLLQSAGLWRFASLDSLASGRSNHYERGLPGPAGPVADFAPRELAVFLQDRWSPTDQLTLSAGLRVDAYHLPKTGATNPNVLATLGIDTHRLPAGGPLWSPRASGELSLDSRRSFLLRGGVGLFGGPPPYRWLANGYRDSGLGDFLLSCDGADVPDFNPVTQPPTCRSGAGGVGRVSALDPALRYPQSFRAYLGVERRLPGELTAAVDLLHLRGVHELYLSDANLAGPVGSAVGEGGRVMYGTIDPAAGGLARPSRRVPTLGQVLLVRNRSGSRTNTLSLELRRVLGRSGEVRGLYAWTRARDVMSLANFAARALLANVPLEGTLESRRPGTSFFETPHRVVLAGSLVLPFRLRLGVIYAGGSQSPFTYVIDGDANADGIGGPSFNNKNDIVYVPARVAPPPGGDIELVELDQITRRLVPASDSVYRSLDQFIRDEPCLERQRGALLRRNSCRNPWSGLLNVRLSKSLRMAARSELELVLDAANLPNLLDRGWGVTRSTTLDPGVPLLTLKGYDPAAQRGIYQLALPRRNGLVDPSTLGRLQLGIRARF